MKEKVTEVQLVEPTKFEKEKPPKKVKLKFPFLDVPVEMNRQFFRRILDSHRYKIVMNTGVETRKNIVS